MPNSIEGRMIKAETLLEATITVTAQNTKDVRDLLKFMHESKMMFVIAMFFTSTAGGIISMVVNHLWK